MAGGGQGVSASQASQLANMLLGAGQSGGSTAAPSTMSNYASPNQNFMQYPQQGQPNQPNQPNALPTIGATPQNQNFMQSSDVTGSTPDTNMGFDNSGSDGGIGGQPAPMQNPFAPQGGKPPSFSQFRPQQGLQIQGNPTSQVVQRPQQR